MTAPAIAAKKESATKMYRNISKLTQNLYINSVLVSVDTGCTVMLDDETAAKFYHLFELVTPSK